MHRQSLVELLHGQSAAPNARGHKSDKESEDILRLRVNACLQRVGREMRMLVENAHDQALADPGLLRIIARALAPGVESQCFGGEIPYRRNREFEDPNSEFFFGLTAKRPPRFENLSQRRQRPSIPAVESYPIALILADSVRNRCAWRPELHSNRIIKDPGRENGSAVFPR